MEKIVQKVLGTVRRNSLLEKKGSRVLLCVSGGADSVFMADIFLLHLKRILRLDCSIFHLDHCLRGEESSADALFVSKLSEKYGCGLFSEKKDIKEERRPGESVESAARRVRYALIQKTLDSEKFDYAATAHNLGDNAETVMMRVIEGASVHSLRGIPYRNGRIIRPIRDITKSEIIEFLEKKDLFFREDSSNLSTVYKRNKIRNILLPLIRSEFNPNIDESLARLSRNCSENNNPDIHTSVVLIEKNGEILLQSPRNNYVYLSQDCASVLRAVLRRFGHEARITESAVDSLTNALNSGSRGTVLKIPFGISAELYSGGAVFRNSQRIPEKSFKGFKIRKGLFTESMDFWISQAEFEKAEWDGIFPESYEYRAFFDKNKIPEFMEVRPPRKTDSISPTGMRGTKKLRVFLADSGIAASAVCSVPVLTDTENNEVIWAAGARINEKYGITDKTRHILKIEIRRKNG
ncbi:MAG: tRNA lysidine(34) synthetase TilS [Fibrobacterota bacterium]